MTKLCKLRLLCQLCPPGRERGETAQGSCGKLGLTAISTWRDPVPLSDRRSGTAQGPFFILMNARSGDKDAAAREATIREVLSQAGRAHTLWPVTDSRQLPPLARQAVELARQQDGTVVAAGGDGTINAVAQAVLNSGCPFGVLPQGTFNYFCRSHGIPLDTAEATRVLLQGVVRPVQVGLVNDRIFLVNASVGLYPKLLENRELHKQRFGRTRLVAFLSALVTLLTPPRQLVLTLEEGGETVLLMTSTLLVENNPLQLEQVGLPEAEAVRQGQLAAIVVRAQGVLQMLSVLVSAALGKLGETDRVATLPFVSLTIKPLLRHRIKVATDGETAWMVPPVEFRVAPQPLLLLVPPAPEGEGGGP